MGTASITESPATSPVHLSSAQRQLAARLGEAQRKVNLLEANVREETERLANARDIYNAACIRVAKGETADISAARSKVLHYEEKILGMKALLREPQALLAEMQRELAAEVARVDEERLAVEILDEQDAIEKQTERALLAIQERDRCIESIAAIVAGLRSRTYRTANNKHAAFQLAHKIERRAAGLQN